MYVPCGSAITPCLKCRPLGCMVTPCLNPIPHETPRFSCKIKVEPRGWSSGARDLYPQNTCCRDSINCVIVLFTILWSTFAPHCSPLCPSQLSILLDNLLTPHFTSWSQLSILLGNVLTPDFTSWSQLSILFHNLLTLHFASWSQLSILLTIC